MFDMYGKNHKQGNVNDSCYVASNGGIEDMGYLPGEMERKMEPWTHFYDGCFENYLTRITPKGTRLCRTIEFESRTFNDSFIITNENANNTLIK